MSTSTARAFDQLAFAALAERAKRGVVERERRHELAIEFVRDPVALQFAASRVPEAFGGEGADLEQTFSRLIDLSTADPNLAHLFRGHLAFIEQQFFEPDEERRRLWYRRVLDGELVGNAQSERVPTSTLTTTLAADGDDYLLNGTKYYSTASILADWIDLAARFGDEDYQVITSTHVPGVHSVDDWNGFGQQLSASGTTTFEQVRVPRGDARPYSADGPHKHAYLTGFFQLVLLGVVAGIGRAVVDDAVAYTRPRRRIFGQHGEVLPRENALVQNTIGSLSSSAFIARAAVIASARRLDDALKGYLDGDPDLDPFITAQLDVYRAQQTVLPTVIGAASELFEVGGSSAVDRDLAFDRHWRNARTIATHNPASQRRRVIGDFELNGTLPE